MKISIFYADVRRIKDIVLMIIIINYKINILDS